MTWLKADLHIHTNKDLEHSFINYTPEEVIDVYARKGFDVISITHHDSVYAEKKLEEYARKKGIILFFGCEKTIKNKHVLLINTKEDIVKRINSFEDLARVKKRNTEMVVIAPHPYLPIKNALKSQLIKNIKLFDGLEISHFYTRLFNFNKKTIKIAKKYSLPLIGTSDAHHYLQIGRTYSLINAKKKKEDIIKALKEGKVMCVTKPLPILISIWLAIKIYLMSKKEERLNELREQQQKMLRQVKKVKSKIKKFGKDIERRVKTSLQK